MNDIIAKLEAMLQEAEAIAAQNPEDYNLGRADQARFTVDALNAILSDGTFANALAGRDLAVVA
jgi:hypothetical protein